MHTNHRPQSRNLTPREWPPRPDQDSAASRSSSQREKLEQERAATRAPNTIELNELSQAVGLALNADSENNIHAATFDYEARQLVEKAFAALLIGRDKHCSYPTFPPSWEALKTVYTPEALSAWAEKIFIQTHRKPSEPRAALLQTPIPEDKKNSILSLAQLAVNIVHAFADKQIERQQQTWRD